MKHRSISRLVAVVASGALLASLTVATVAAPAAAGPEVKCAGRVATIVGTAASEVIKGTHKRDVIAALGGNDKIFGLRGNDVICGGPGNDVIAANKGADLVYGGQGNDRVLGNLGPDRLFGNAGNDNIDGGRGTDKCWQNTGMGPMVRCGKAPAAPVAPVAPPKPEPTPTPPPPPPPPPEADFSVAVTGNEITLGGAVSFEAVVSNDGPDAATYSLVPVFTQPEGDPCTTTQSPSGKKAELASGDQKSWVYAYTCVAIFDNVTLEVEVKPADGAIDADPGNNTDDLTTFVIAG